MRFRTHWLSALAIGMTVAGCDSAPPVNAPRLAASLSSRLTPAAAEALTAAGTFVDDAPESPDGTPMITSQQAVAQAMAFVRSYGQSFYPTWQRQHGGSFDLATVAPDSRVYFAHTPYAGTPRTLLPAMRRAYGPYFLVTLKAGTVPTVIVAVSAYNTDVRVHADGRIQLAKFHGADIIANGIPMDPERYALLSPEEAVDRVTAETGALVSSRPRLVLLGIRRMPVLPAWEVTLDRDVSVQERGASAAHAVRTLMVGVRAKERYLRPGPQGPTSVTTRGPSMTAKGERGAVTAVQVAVRNGFTVAPLITDLIRRN